MSIATLGAADLALRVDAASLGFADTSELLAQDLPWIGQERAEQAARFGLRMQQPDYHLFVLGETGSGRSTLMRQLMHAEAATRPVPPDLCYVHDFETPEQPRALRLPAGQGRLLRRLMGELAKLLQTEIPKWLTGPDFLAERERVERGYKAAEGTGFDALSAFAEARRFALMREQGRLVFTQRDEQGEALTASKAMTLTREQRAALEAAEDELIGEIGRFQEGARVREADLDERLEALRRRMLQPLFDRALRGVRDPLHQQIEDSASLGRYLEQAEQDLLDNLELFQPGDDDDESERVPALIEVLSRLRVNVVVDNHGSQGAPVLVDDNPLFRSLFGSIEYESENEVLVADFSRIRAGSLLRAHGGFLLLHLRDLLADLQVWEKLRRFLRSGRLQIEEPGMVHAPIAAVSLRPEPVDVDVKIVLIASVEDYYLVQEGDPEVARRFRCKVDFVESFAATEQTRRATSVFVAQTCRRMGLPHFSAAATAAVIEATHRDAQDQRRQSAVFARTEALVLEAAAAARSRTAGLVESQDVRAAIEARIQRHDHPQQRLQETIGEGERLIEVGGERVGRLNGLTVVDLGDHRFGFPVRVSASTCAGEEGLLNIEREVALSGPIHDKGVLILHSHLASLFAHIAPLALNAAVVFEQEYGGVEGDSASCAEFYALLSSLSGLPLRQGIAATGALSPHGEVMPVGAINEKIEGFFSSCLTLGLDGQQGVLMPHRNRRHLMLSPRVVEAVAAGRFHIHTIERVSEGMELLTGRPFGTRGPGGYLPDTVLGRAERNLQAYRRACQALETKHRARWPRGPCRQPRESRRR